MRRTEPLALGDLLKEFIDENQLGDGLSEGRAREAWIRVAGDYVVQCTRDLYIREGRMFISFTSPIARNEVFMRRTEIIRRINKMLGNNYIKVIIFK